MKHTLSLKREHLVELTSDEMSGVHGAVMDATPSTPVRECLLRESWIVCTYTHGC